MIPKITSLMIYRLVSSFEENHFIGGSFVFSFTKSSHSNLLLCSDDFKF